MIHTMDCKARVNAQDPTYPTFKSMDCLLHCNANTNWYSGIMDCEATITSIIVTACKGFNQGIRLVVTIDDIDVSAALVGNISIQHDKNKISTFSLGLGDTQYSPRTNSHIDLEKVVVITAYINGQEKKLFTGSVDEPEAENNPAFRVIVTGRDYGKMLLDKVTTVVSVQDLADTTKRNDLIKYLASLAGQTNVDIPEMDEVTIDNSFQDQSVWDMIQKEAMVEQYWVGHNEDGRLELKLDEIKSDSTLYPTPDWTYEEDRIIRVGYKRGRVDINKIIVLGKTDQIRIPHTITEMTNPGVDYTTPALLFSDSLSFSDGELIEYNANNNYTKKIGDFTLSIFSYGYSFSGGNIHIAVGCNSQNTWESYIITEKTETVGGDITLNKIVSDIGMGGHTGKSGILWVLTRGKGSLGGYPTNYQMGQKGGAFTFNVTVNGYLNRESTPATYETNTTYETRYDQISASVTDPNSIAKYGERDGGSVTYPLLETVEQCEAVGAKIIRDSHRLLGQSDFEIPFNPLIKTGQTIAVTDNKIGLDERYLVEKISHNIDINEGKVKARTQVGGVLYA